VSIFAPWIAFLIGMAGLAVWGFRIRLDKKSSRRDVGDLMEQLKEQLKRKQQLHGDTKEKSVGER
jgi:hypothetical protein